MQGLALLHGLVALAPLEQGAGIVVQIGIAATGRNAAFGGIEVLAVPFPAAREVDALGTVAAGAVLALQEHHFVAVVQLRNTAQGGQQGDGQLHAAGVLPEDVSGAGMVMVGEESEEVGDIVVHEVLGQHGIHAGHALVPPHLILAQSGMDGMLQREVHHGGQVGIEAVLVGIVLLPIGHLRDVVVPALAHDVHIGILLQHGLAPLAHGAGLVIGIGVYPETVQIGVLYPPDSPLLEILENVGVVQVHIRHGRHEPAALLALPVPLGGRRIHVHTEEGVHLHVGLVHMIPVMERRFLHPPVLGAAVVGDNVHNHLEAFLVALLNKLTVQLIIAEAGVDVIVVGASIAVVTLPVLIIQEERRAPDGRSAQVGHIVQVVDDALEVAAVAGHGILAVHGVGQLGNLPLHGRSVIVGRDYGAIAGLVGGIAVGKAVRHDKVYHIGRSEAFPLGTPLAAGLYAVGILEPAAVFPLEEEIMDGSRGGRAHLHVHKHEVGAVGGMYLLDFEVFTARRNLRKSDIGALHHELEVGFHAGPPEQGFYPLDVVGRCIRNRCRVYLGGKLAGGQQPEGRCCQDK